MSNSVRPQRWQPTRLFCPWDSPGKNTGVGCHFLLQCMRVKSETEVDQLCPTLRDPMDCSPPGSSIHGIFQARVLEWGAIAFSVLYTNNDLFEKEIKKTTSFTVSLKIVKYLGINWMRWKISILKTKTLMKEIEEGTKKWKYIPCLWIRKLILLK